MKRNNLIFVIVVLLAGVLLGHPLNIQAASSPSTLPLRDGWSGVWTKNLHALAMKTDGSVWGWGHNNGGQVGDGTLVRRYLPVQVRDSSGTGYLDGVSSLASGSFHSLALTTDGRVYAWGSNNRGQLGNGTVGGNFSLPAFVKDPSGTGEMTGVTQMDAGSFHTLVLKSDGTVWAFGENLSGKLGNGSVSGNAPLPVQVKDPSGSGFLTGIIFVSAGFDHSIAVKSDGTVYCWGVNNSGQCGTGTTNASLPLPVAANITNVRTAVVGSAFTLFLKNDETVWSTGWNASGTLGTGNTASSTAPVPVLAETGAGQLSGITKVYGAAYSSVVTDSSGNPLAWGENATYLHLSVGGSANQLRPAKVLRNSSPLTPFGPINHAAISGSNLFLIKPDRTLWAVGNNQYGQLGNGSRVDRVLPYMVGTTPPPLNPSSSSFTSSALTQTSVTLNWADNINAYNFIIRQNGTQVFSGLATTASIAGLNPGSTYTFELIAQNSGGNGVPRTLTLTTPGVARSVNLTPPTPLILFPNTLVNGSVQTVHAALSPLRAEHTGTNTNGWKITVAATQLRQVNGPLTLPLNSLLMKGVASISRITGTGTISALSGTPGHLDGSAFQLFKGNPGEAEGVFDLNFPPQALELTVDTGRQVVDPLSNPTVYRTTITYTISTGP